MEYMFISCFAFLTVIAVAFFIKPKIDNEDTKLYSKIIIANLIGITIDTIQYLLINHNVNTVISIILGKIYLIYVFSWTYLLSTYTINIGKNNENVQKQDNTVILNKIIRYLLALGIISVLIAPIEIVNNDLGIYTKGPACIVGYIVVSTYIVIDVIGTLTNIKGVKDKKKYIPFFVFMFIGMLATIIQAVHPQLLLITPVESLITMLTYFFIENPDVKMIEQLEIAKEQADKANNAKSDFLSNMSHEIRTPLNAIVGFSESLKDDNLPQESKEKVDDIIMASNNLLDIVNGILDISKIEANKLEIINKEYDIKSVLDELTALTKARIGDKGLDFRVNIDPALPRVLYGDNVRLKQVILNILTNAVKYTKEGYVIFTVSSVIKNDICRLIISVEDSGIGIKQESIPKLFSKFERLDVEKETTIEGTGLGLAITKKLIELMNGTIVVQSVYGKGSKFTISIDQRVISIDPPVIYEGANTSSKVVDAKGAKVLIVDDNELNLKVAQVLLKKYHFDIDTSTNGPDCLNKIHAGNQYDIILLDDMMPKMSGKEVLNKLKEITDFHIPVIALTANAITGMKQEYLNMGFDDYLSKPIEKNELERVIKQYLGNRQTTTTNSNVSPKTNSILKKDFSIELPLLAANETAPNKDKKILIVDDDEIIRKIAENALKDTNYMVEAAGSGREAILKVIDNKYDIIFIDEMMPELDGCTTFKNFKDIDGFNTPTIMMSSISKEDLEKKINEYGFAGYLSKPFTKEGILSKINEILK